MNIRLIKPDTSLPREEVKPPPDDGRMIDTIRSWVHTFKSEKAENDRLDFGRLNGAQKT
jgi:hypothetical protein